MRMIRLVTVVSSVLLGASMAHAGDKAAQEKFTAADTDRDGSLTLTELETGMPTLAAQFSSIDSNADGKVSVDELNAFNKGGDKSMESDEAKATPPTDK